MLENLKSGNIIKRLEELSKLASEFDKYNHNKKIEEFLPNCKTGVANYTYVWSGTDIEVNTYEFNVAKVNYGFEDRGMSSLFYIKVNDIVIFHNRDKYSCNGVFEGLEAGWNHTYPPEMFKAIKEDIIIIDKCIKDIKYYLSGKDKYYQEKLELEKIFCK